MRRKRMAAVLAALLVIGLLGGCGSSGGAPEAETAAEEAVLPEVTGDAAGNFAAGEADPGKTDSETANKTDGSEAAENTQDEQPENTVPELTRQIDSTDGTMRLFIPEYWSDMSGRLDGPGLGTAELDARYPLKAACYEEASFFIGTHEKKDGTPIADLEDYMDTLFRGVTQNGALSDVQVGQSLELTIEKSGLPALRRDFTARYKDKTITCWLYAVEGGARYYQLMAWTTSGNVLSAQPLIEAIAGTFEEISP